MELSNTAPWLSSMCLELLTACWLESKNQKAETTSLIRSALRRPRASLLPHSLDQSDHKASPDSQDRQITSAS